MIIIIMILIFILGVNPAFAASVVLDRDEFVQLLANVDLLKQKLANADQQIALYIKARDERDKIIAIQKQQIGELESMIRDYDAMGKTQEELIMALEQRFAQREQMDWYQNVGLGVLVIALCALALLK